VGPSSAHIGEDLETFIAAAAGNQPRNRGTPLQGRKSWLIWGIQVHLAEGGLPCYHARVRRRMAARGLALLPPWSTRYIVGIPGRALADKRGTAGSSWNPGIDVWRAAGGATQGRPVWRADRFGMRGNEPQA